MTRQIKGLKSDIFTFRFFSFQALLGYDYRILEISKFLGEHSQALKEHLVSLSQISKGPELGSESLESARSFALDRQRGRGVSPQIVRECVQLVLYRQRGRGVSLWIVIEGAKFCSESLESARSWLCIVRDGAEFRSGSLESIIK